MWIVIFIVILLIVILHIVLPKKYVSPRKYWYLRKIPSLPQLPYIGSAHKFLVPNEDNTAAHAGLEAPPPKSIPGYLLIEPTFIPGPSKQVEQEVQNQQKNTNLSFLKQLAQENHTLKTVPIIKRSNWRERLESEAANVTKFLPLLEKLCDIYKPILLIDVMGFHHVFLTEVDDIMVIFNSRLHTEKSEDYVFLLPWLGEGLLTSNGQKWFSHRKLLTPAFHFRILEQYMEVLNKNAKILTEQLNTRSNNEFIEINPLVTLCTLDVICETAMGTSVNAQLGGEKDYVKATLKVSTIIQERLLVPWLYRNFIFNLMPQGREQKRLLKILHGFTEKVIRERKEAYMKEQMNTKTESQDPDLYFGVKKKMSFLDLLISENRLTDAEIREEVDTFMFEGHDTTATAICWTLFELGHHPEIQKRAYEEQREIFHDSLRAATSSDLQEMKYLERIIKESLRLYPSVPIISRKLEKDVTIKGYVIPEGTNVPAFIYYLHRNKDLFPEPLKFDPDRFLTDQVLNRHPYAYIPFSAGSRNCIGQKFAEMEEKVILSNIIRNFEFKSLDSRDDIKLMAELILRPKNNLRIAFKPRRRLI